jgi:hypothetical protein
MPKSQRSRALAAGLVYLGISAAVGCLDLGSLDESETAPPASPKDSGPLPSTDAADAGVISNDGGSNDGTGTLDVSGIPDVVSADAGADGGWAVYSYSEANLAWDPVVTVAALWPVPEGSGLEANRPTTGISSVCQFSSLDRILVFDTAGTLYRRVNGTWVAPTPANNVFPGLAPAVPTSTYHIPLPDGGTSEVSVVMVQNPKAYLYTYHSTDFATQDQAPITMSDDAGAGIPGPPQFSGIGQWDYEIFDISKYGVSGAWAYFYLGYGNDVYRLDGAGLWTKWAAGSFPMFSKPGAPVVANIRAAFYDKPAARVRMIVIP